MSAVGGGYPKSPLLQQRFSTTKGSSCMDNVEKNYMLYLAFDNSFCDQYVTEKLWRWLSVDVVPVVMGQADYAAIALS